MEKFEITVASETEVEITSEDIDDIMVGALEGGIIYWCRKVEVIGEYLGEYASDQISRGGELKFYCVDERDPYVLTRDKLLNGVEKLIENGSKELLENGEETFRISMYQLDACACDAIIQYALFDEIVYG